ncbi:MAG TPA: glycyl-radical enzyme activating protein, partial [Phycisphaerae bacterium]|nr:glycyl-radical enzyme activating protein [Phycisphaerae bacterium]
MTVSDIQRFSIHDGPGIRTTVFLKGCNLRCRWCHNPENLRPGAELQLFPSRCIGCGACLTACPKQAHTMTDGARRFDRAACVSCGSCAAGCYARALVLVGRALTVADVLEEVVADREFYDNSGGGVTLSGGEPLFQLEFACELLRACRAEGIRTAIETN